jgi:hypothetical protein
VDCRRGDPRAQPALPQRRVGGEELALGLAGAVGRVDGRGAGVDVQVVPRRDHALGVKAGLDVVLNHETSLFTNRTVQLSVYAVAGNSTDYLALHYVGYGAEISGSNYAAKAINGTSADFQALYAFGFNSSSLASSKSNLVTSTYQHGLDYYLLDNYVVAKVPVYPEELFIELMGF